MTLKERILRIEKILVELRNQLRQLGMDGDKFIDVEVATADKLLWEIELEHREL